MSYYEDLQFNWNVLAEDALPYVKLGYDPMVIISDIEMQLRSPQQGVQMRIPMLHTFLRQEASMPKGMTLTRKVAGGSLTASIKREFGLKKGLSKKRTFEVFSLFVEFVTHILQSRGDISEVYEITGMHYWSEEDGCYIFDELWGKKQ